MKEVMLKAYKNQTGVYSVLGHEQRSGDGPTSIQRAAFSVQSSELRFAQSVPRPRGASPGAACVEPARRASELRRRAFRAIQITKKAQSPAGDCAGIWWSCRGTAPRVRIAGPALSPGSVSILS